MRLATVESSARTPGPLAEEVHAKVKADVEVKPSSSHKWDHGGAAGVEARKRARKRKGKKGKGNRRKTVAVVPSEEKKKMMI